MLRETHRRVKQIWPDATIAIHGHVPARASEMRQTTLTVADGWGRGSVASQHKAIYPTASRRSRHGGNIVNAHEIDLILDISGFALSDQWGWRKSARVALYTNHAKAHNTPVIFLPQSFGPFEQRRTHFFSKRALAAASCIHARDLQSYDVVSHMLGSSNQIRRTPDLTIPVTVAPTVDVEPGTVALVPNIRLTDMGGKTEGEHVVQAFADLGRKLQRHGLRVVVAPHTTEQGDHDLSAQLAEKLNPEAPVWEGIDAYTMKARLAACHLVVAARYHAAVAALSSGVPCIVVGWSHKYASLVEDFGLDIEQHCVQASRLQAGNLYELAVSILSEREPVSEILLDRTAKLSDDVEQMWTSLADFSC